MLYFGLDIHIKFIVICVLYSRDGCYFAEVDISGSLSRRAVFYLQ